MRDNVIVAYRGANYELGQWPYGYGIWSSANQEPLPLEWWDADTGGLVGRLVPVRRARGARVDYPGQRGSSGRGWPGRGWSRQPGTHDCPWSGGQRREAPATPPGQGTDTPPASASGLRRSSAAGRPPAATAPAGTGGAGTGHPGPAYAAWAPTLQAQPAAGTTGTATTGTAAPAPQLSSGRALLAAALLAAGVVLGVIGLFPSYSGSQPGLAGREPLAAPDLPGGLGGGRGARSSVAARCSAPAR